MILDEPTMGLSLSETKKALDFVREIREAGKSASSSTTTSSTSTRSRTGSSCSIAGHCGQFKKKEITFLELIERMHHVAETGSIENAGTGVTT